MKNGDYFIYTLSCPITGHVRYIGVTTNIKKRFTQHCSPSSLKTRRSKKHQWISSLLNNGLKPTIEVLESCGYESVKFLESYWIDQFRSWNFDLTNTLHGGTNANQSLRSDLSKRKKGIALTDGHKKAISAANKGRKDWLPYLPVGHKPNKPVSLFTVDGVLVRSFASSKQAGEFYGISQSVISNNIKGLSKTTKQGIWKR